MALRCGVLLLQRRDRERNRTVRIFRPGFPPGKAAPPFSWVRKVPMGIKVLRRISYVLISHSMQQLPTLRTTSGNEVVEFQGWSVEECDEMMLAEMERRGAAVRPVSIDAKVVDGFWGISVGELEYTQEISVVRRMPRS